jgi:hypothetical protein
MKIKPEGKCKDGTPKLFLLPETPEETAFVEKQFKNIRDAQLRMVGDAKTGIRVQLKLKPEV